MGQGVAKSMILCPCDATSNMKDGPTFVLVVYRQFNGRHRAIAEQNNISDANVYFRLSYLNERKSVSLDFVNKRH